MLLLEVLPELKEMALPGIDYLTSKYESILSPHDLIVSELKSSELD